MAKLSMGDIVAAQLQNAPDYSPSAPLFLSTLYSLSGGASYYNPGQAGQAIPVNIASTANPLVTTSAAPTGTGSPVPSASTVPMPSATTAGMPSITDTGNGPSGGYGPGGSYGPDGGYGYGAAPGPGPYDLRQRMPSIVQPNTMVIGGCGNPMAQWINDNPLLALAGLAALAWLVARR